MPLSGTYHSWQTVKLTLCQHLLYGAFSVNRCVRAYREKASAAYARTQQNAQILLYRGSCPPTVGRKVRLHKGFNADKAPDELTMLLVDSRLYLRWLAISASLNPRALIAFRLFSSHHIL